MWPLPLFPGKGEDGKNNVVPAKSFGVEGRQLLKRKEVLLLLEWRKGSWTDKNISVYYDSGEPELELRYLNFHSNPLLIPLFIHLTYIYWALYQDCI